MNDWFEAEERVERAHRLYEDGRWDEAERELREAISVDPYRAEWHFNLGLTLEAAGKWTDAASAFREAHELEPGDQQAVLLVGVNCLRCDDVPRAIEWLNRAASVDPARAEPHIHLIEAHARQSSHDDAEVAFYRAIQLDGDHALAYANMAESLIDREQFERAIYCLREAAAIDPRLQRVHARLAHAYAQTGRHERSRQLYLRELRDAPGDIDTLLDLGCLLVDMNRWSEAGEKFRRVLEIESDNCDAHFYLADLAERQHRAKEAAASYRLVLRLEPDYPEARRRLAALLLAQGDLAEARKLLRHEARAWRAEPGDFDAVDLEELGRLLLDARLPREAVRIFASLTEQKPEDPALWHSFAFARFQMGDRAGGVDAERNSLRLDPTNVAALHNMALASMQDRAWGRARCYLRLAQRLDRDDHALRRLALTYRLLRAMETARGFLGAVLGGRRRA